MAEEWSEWFEHDNAGWPDGLKRGDVVLLHMETGDFLGPMRATELDWAHPDAVARYRIRRPRGLTILQELIEKLPETVEA